MNPPAKKVTMSLIEFSEKTKRFWRKFWFEVTVGVTVTITAAIIISLATNLYGATVRHYQKQEAFNAKIEKTFTWIIKDSAEHSELKRDVSDLQQGYNRISDSISLMWLVKNQ